MEKHEAFKSKEETSEKEKKNIIDFIKDGKIDLVTNIPKNFQKEELTKGCLIRRVAVDYNVILITNRQIAPRLVEALVRKSANKLQINSRDEYI